MNNDTVSLAPFDYIASLIGPVTVFRGETPESERSFSGADIQKLVPTLPINQRDLEICNRRLGFTGDPMMTLAEAGKPWGLSKERVRSIQNSMISKLRRLIWRIADRGLSVDEYLSNPDDRGDLPAKKISKCDEKKRNWSGWSI